jgi:hypothetical protein
MKAHSRLQVFQLLAETVGQVVLPIFHADERLFALTLAENTVRHCTSPSPFFLFALQPVRQSKPVSGKVKVCGDSFSVFGIQGQIEKRVRHFPRSPRTLKPRQRIECMAHTYLPIR